MDTHKRRPLASLSCLVAHSAPHQIRVCKACKHGREGCAPGQRLLARLRDAIAAAGLGDEFELSGTACLSGCVPDHGGPCVVAWRATAKATWLFGDIDPDDSVDDMVAFARRYDAPDEGWMTAAQGAPLARIPAAIIVTRQRPLQ